MGKRIDICQQCDEIFTVDQHTGEGECPICSLDYQDARPVEFVDGNLRHIDKTQLEDNNYYDEFDVEELPDVEDVEIEDGYKFGPE